MLLSLKSRLLSVEQEFLSALVNGADALVAFQSRWEGLLEDVNNAMETPESHPAISALAHITATRVAALADASIDICDIYNTHSSLLMAEIDNLMSELSVGDRPFGEHPGTVNLKTRCSGSISCHGSPTPTCRKRSRGLDVSSPEKVTKRRRTPNTCNAPSDRLPRSPSPPTTTYSITNTIEDTHTTPPFRSSRKRRLSDVDIPPFHPLKRLYTGPRVHAVSDSYPTSLVREQHLVPPALHPDVAGSSTSLDVAVPLDIRSLAALPKSHYGKVPEPGIFDDCQIGDLRASYEDPTQSLLQLNDMDAFLDTLLHLPVMTSPQLFASSASFDATVSTDDTFGPLSPSCPPLIAPRSPSTSSSSPSSSPRTPPLSLLDCDIPLYVLDHSGAPADGSNDLPPTCLETHAALRVAPSRGMNGAIQFSFLEYSDASEPIAEWLRLASDEPTDPLACSGTPSHIKHDNPCVMPEATPLVQSSCHDLRPSEGILSS